MPQNHFKMGKTVKKLGPLFNFKLGPLFNFKTPNLGPLFNFTAYPKNDNFAHFAKHRLIKNPLCCNPLFFEKLVVFLNLHFLKKNTDVEQKTKLKIRKKSKDKERGI